MEGELSLAGSRQAKVKTKEKTTIPASMEARRSKNDDVRADCGISASFLDRSIGDEMNAQPTDREKNAWPIAAIHTSGRLSIE